MVNRTAYYKTFVFTLIIGSLIIGLMPTYFHPYHLKKQHTFHRKENDQRYLYDLDQDGDFEIIYKNRHTDWPAINYYKSNNQIIDQLTFYDREVPGNLFFGDYDHDGNHEMLIAYTANDSLCLGGLEMNDDIRTFEKIFICKVPQLRGNADISTGQGIFLDLTQDGFDELVFPAYAGFSLQPRKIYAYDFVKDSVFHSPYFEAQTAPLAYTRQPFGEYVVIPGFSTTMNYPDTAKYGDNHAWAVMLDQQLNFTFPPKRILNQKSGSMPYPIKGQEPKVIYYTPVPNPDQTDSLFHLVNLKGDILRSVSSPQSMSNIRHVDYLSDSTLILVMADGAVHSLDDQLTFTTIGRLPVHIDRCWTLDIDADGRLEYVVSTKVRKRLIVFQDHFSDATHLDFESSIGLPNFHCHATNADGKVYLMALSQQNHFLLTYSKNPWYWLRYLLYLGIYLGTLALIWGTNKIYRLYISDKERQIQTLQLKNFRNQFDTHFTFNILNTIGAVIYEEKPDKAHRLFTKFSRLIRKAVENSHRMTVTLQEEVSYINEYLELQQFRFKDRLQYRVAISPDVDQFQPVPKLLIQSYVENAFKHAFNTGKSVNELNVKIDLNEQKATIITIQDNGPGLDQSVHTQGTRKGLQLMVDYFELFHLLQKIKITQKAETLKDQSFNAIGTQITLTIMPHDKIHHPGR